MELEIEKLHKELYEALENSGRDSIQVHNLIPESSCTYNIDGENHVASISFWANGLCDVESIEIKSEKRNFNHFEFNTYEEAKETILNYLKLAIKNA